MLVGTGCISWSRKISLVKLTDLENKILIAQASSFKQKHSSIIISPNTVYTNFFQYSVNSHCYSIMLVKDTDT